MSQAERAAAARSVLSGLAIATLLLYPLLNALTGKVDELQWRTQDTVETALAWLALGGIVAATLEGAARGISARAAEVVNACWLAVGGFFVIGGVVKTSWLNAMAGDHRELAPLLVAAVFLGFLTVAFVCIRSDVHVVRRPMRQVTLVISPVVAVMLFNLAHMQWIHHEPPSRVYAATAGRRAGVPLTVVLLFDELSPDFLYGPTQPDLRRLPHLRQFLDESSIRTQTFLHGGATELAIPTLFAGRADAGQGAARQSLVDELVAAHHDVRIWGWYLDYCGTFAESATRCAAASSYNARTVDPGWSLLHPLWTDVDLLPSNAPYGVLKVLPALALHARTLTLARQWLDAQIADPASEIVYAHLNVPHVPYLDNSSAFPDIRSRFVMTPDRYVAQLRWVDDTLSDVMRDVGTVSGVRQVKVVVMSDHNARKLFPEAQHEHIVYLTWDSVTRSHADLTERADGADLLRRLLLRRAATG